MNRLAIESLSGPAFGPVSLVIEPGECVCLSGPSGAGKTVLLRAIADLDVHQGVVRVGDQLCESMPAPQWRQKVGLLTANSSWWLGTTGAHMPKVNGTDVEQLGLAQNILKKPIAQLSTGELQRLALLRLLTNQPAVLLLDEPTASLDAENVERVEALVKQYREQHNAAVLWVSHDKAQAKRVASRQFKMVAGKLTEAGSW